MLYCINLKTSQIHVLGCRHIAQKNIDKNFLGRFKNPDEAIIDAKGKGFMNAKLCSNCCSIDN